MDQVQVIGTHNSYHVAPHPALMDLIRREHPGDASAVRHTHRPIREQLERLGVRQIELDLYADPDGGLFASPAGAGLAASAGYASFPTPPADVMREPGAKVLHVPDIDFQTTVPTLRRALEEIARWSAENAAHVPILVLLEFREASAGAGYTRPLPWTMKLLEEVEREILGVFAAERLLLPDDVRKGRPSLREAVQGNGWPELAAARGRILFAMANLDHVRDLYLAPSRTLAGRLMFVSVDEGHPAAAWFRIDDPVGGADTIRRLVARGFMVRTRADADLREALNADARRRDAAFASGAQWISTDFPEPDPSLGDYAVRWTGGIIARANPVSLPGVDPGSDLEELAVRGLEPFHAAELALLNDRAMAFHQERRLAEASRDYRRLLELDPAVPPSDTIERRILELAPLLRTVPGERFRLETAVAIHHPTEPLIGYHLFWGDDIDFPDDSDPTDHEVVWIRYEPVSGRAVRAYAYFHGQILEAVPDPAGPVFAVEWGKHGSLPVDAAGRAPEPASLRRHWERLHREGIRDPDHPHARRWPKRFDGDWAHYRRFTEAVDVRTRLERRPRSWISAWPNAVLDQHALPYNFAPKIEWPPE